jgi:membrane protease YdiL (CAAX protease family)
VPSSYPPPYPPYPHARREPYHRILHTWSYRYWRVLVGIVLTVLAAFLASLPVGVVVGLVLQMLGLGSVAEVVTSLDLEGPLQPATLLVVNLSLALMIPITWLAVRYLHNLRPRWLGSVRPRLRWSLVGWFLAASVLSTAAAYLTAGLLIPSELPTSGGAGGSGVTSGATTAAFLVIIALTSPLQAAGEEYFFRGYLLQGFGALVRAPWFTVICTSLLFATAHGSQNLPLFVDRFAFGAVAGGLVIFTGGIEAGIAMHVVNNVVVLGAAAATGTITQTLATTGAGWTVVVVDLGQFAVYAGLVVLMCRRLRPQRLTPGPPEGAQAPAPSGPPATPSTAP